MRSTKHISMVRAGWFTEIFLAIASLGLVYAQETRPQNQIFLPPAAGGTALSFQIEAEAKYVATQGAFLESAAIARKINAEAVALEIQNSVDYVDAYFKRRELNRQWREKERGGNFQEHEAKRQEAMKRSIDQLFQNTLKGDVTEKLNWLLENLYMVQYMSPGDIKPLDSPLSKEDMEQIYLTDGGRGGSKLVFTAGDGEMLKPPWPYALRRSKFDAARKEFEDSRDAVIMQIQGNGRANEESGERTLKAVNQLMVALETVYPQEVRKDSKVFLQYHSAKSFVQSLTVQTSRALNTNDSAVFSGSLSFKGSTVLDLIQHMCKLGLRFDRPQEGGERVYSGLFMNMRSVYSIVGTGKNDGGVAPAKN